MSSAAIDGVPPHFKPYNSSLLLSAREVGSPTGMGRILSQIQSRMSHLAHQRPELHPFPIPPIATSSSTHHFTISLQYMTLQTPTTPAHLSGGKDKIPISGLSKAQMIVVKQQIDEAARLGLVSRYWDVPSWAVNLRMAV
ncbi:uncharacterized protein RAG0_12711 [Rhynchosporium agropyri]|uniref:Uncharacterized protein n=1 Tax=Rhynchosporium agropyri TaxID=914238 RepID=A0A1E1L9D3_9HELO|nr:uncharacterized protein RAG0_12711 [Rhynchosporium agropyri]